MKVSWVLFFLFLFFLPGWNAWGQEDGLFSGLASVEGGMYSPSTTGTYGLSRLLLKNEDDLASDLLFSFAGEAEGPVRGAGPAPLLAGLSPGERLALADR